MSLTLNEIDDVIIWISVSVSRKIRQFQEYISVLSPKLVDGFWQTVTRLRILFQSLLLFVSKALSEQVSLPTTPVIRVRMKNILIGWVLIILLVTLISSVSSGSKHQNTFIISSCEEQSKSARYFLETRAAKLDIYEEENSVKFRLQNSNAVTVLSGTLGARLPPALGPPEHLEVCPGGEDECFSWSDVAAMSVTARDETCFDVRNILKGYHQSA